MKRRKQTQRATVYKLCSLALQYPDDELVAAREELAAVAAALTDGPAPGSISRFYDWFVSVPALDLARHYVQVFDLGKRSALYLTFYSLGDRRDRGLALLRLKKLYRTAGLPQQGSELPDYLPVMLEFASAAPAAQGDLVLAEHRAAIELVRLSLREQESPYAHALDAVCAQLGGLSAAERLRLNRLIAQGPPQELVGLEPFGAAPSASGLVQRRAAPGSSGSPTEAMPSTGARR
jgi:nitrate reductase delta subunit